MFSELVKEWYMVNYPDDELGAEIREEITWYDIFDTLDAYQDIYDTIGVNDSIIRERIFEELARRMNVDYDYIYNQWLRAV